MILEIKLECYNWWNYPIYRTKNNSFIVNNGDGYYSLSNPTDIDSEPYYRLKDDCIKIVEEFSYEEE